MPGIITRLIDALLGIEETEKDIHESGRLQHHVQGKVQEKPEITPKSSESKDWVPELPRNPAAGTRSNEPKKQEIPQKSRPEQALEPERNVQTRMPESEEGGIVNMIGRAYNKMARTISEKLKKQKVLIASPILIALAIAILSLTPFFSYVKGFLIIIALIFAAAISKLTQKIFPFVVGFDLCLFFTVLAGVAYHPFVGLFVGIFSSALGSVARGQYDMDKVIIPLLGYIVVSLALPMLPFTGIFNIGMASALIYAVMMSIIFGITMGFCPMCLFNTATFFVTSVGFHYWLFSNYAAGLLGIMTG